MQLSLSLCVSKFAVCLVGRRVKLENLERERKCLCVFGVGGFPKIYNRKGGSSGFFLFPSSATVPMPFGFQVIEDLDLKSVGLFSKIWSKLASGQTAFVPESFLLTKCLTGGLACLENFFWFPLLIALNVQLLVNGQSRRCGTCCL